MYDQPMPGTQPQVVYMARPAEPLQPEISEDTRRKHHASKQKYPRLNLSEAEFVISAVERHPIGLLQIWVTTGLVIFAVIGLVALLATSSDTLSTGFGTDISPLLLAVPALLISLLALLFAFISTSIYQGNKFYLTNESVIQYIRTGIFNNRQQTISLANIEDASYAQNGMLQHMLNYGMLRLSTQGDETTYRFTYASNPEQQINTLNNAVEAFKNGRPIGH